MINIENIVTPSPEQWEVIIMGMRNAMNSWEKSDSGLVTHCEVCKYRDDETGECTAEYSAGYDFNTDGCYEFEIGQNDMDLMKRLRNAGTDHRKFMRMITVYVDITAPLYWWKEFDTYKVGTVANSCSTMHKIHEKEFTLEDFSCEHLFDAQSNIIAEWFTKTLYNTIASLNVARDRYLETKDKKYWWQMIQLLPSSYNQKRTVMLNYEVLANMYHSRKNHKLDEWSIGFMDFIKSLPYSELITGDFNKDK